jgi:hypothetical protein
MRGDLLAHRSGIVSAALPEVQPAFVIVVTPTAQRDVVHRRLSTQRVRVDVMELHEPALVAAMACRPDEDATPEVPDPDGALDRGPDRARPRVRRA